MKKETSLQIDEMCHQDSELHNLWYTNTSDEAVLTTLCRPNNTYVFAHQGKSKHTGLWLLSDLLASNSNLIEVGPDRSHEEFVLPEGGITEGLCSQTVTLHFLNKMGVSKPAHS